MNVMTRRPLGAGGTSGVAPSPEEGGTIVQLDDVSKVHLRGGHSNEVLSNLALALGAGEFVAVMGPSGSGKTTLLNLIGGLDRPSHGRVCVNGVAIDRMSRNQLTHWRSTQVSFVFQFYNLIPVLDARGNVALPLSLQRGSGTENNRRAEAALRLVGLEHRISHHPHELSGGEQQRVAIARAIVTNAPLLLCDEPTGDLDRQTGIEVMELLDMLNRDYGKTIVMVTHDPEIARCAHRTVRLDKGRLVQDGA